MPFSNFTVVVFPAPFGPRKPYTSPGPRDRETCLTACLPPGYVFERFSNIIVNKSQEMFLVYFQEILNLDVSIPETQQEYTFELPSHRSATVVMNLMSMK